MERIKLTRAKARLGETMQDVVRVDEAGQKSRVLDLYDTEHDEEVDAPCASTRVSKEP